MAHQPTAEDEVVRLCQELIRIDTSNPGDHSGPGERVAAEYVAEKLSFFHFFLETGRTIPAERSTF